MPGLGFPSRPAVFDVHWIFALIWLIGGAVLEWQQHPKLRLKDIARLNWKLMRAHPAPFLALGYGIWALLAAFFTPDPAVSLTGTLQEGDEGAFWTLLLSGIFVLAYIQSRSDSKTVGRMVGGLLFGATILSLVGIIEVSAQRGIIYMIDSASVPSATFPQRGHLAGYLLFACVAGVYVFALEKQKQKIFLLLCLILIVLVIGLTQNRAVLIGFAAIFVLMILIQREKPKILMIIIALSLFYGAGYVAKDFVKSSSRSTVADTISSELRLIYWKSAVGAIVHRPVFGWGAGGFYEVWADYLSKSELKKALLLEFGLNYQSHSGNLFSTKNDSGKIRLFTIGIVRTHNQFLEVAVIRGIVGLIFYVFLLLFCFKNMRSPLTLAVIAYHAFLMLWYLPIEPLGALWAVWGAAMSNQKTN
jgi:O-antigen ligase